MAIDFTLCNDKLQDGFAWDRVLTDKEISFLATNPGWTPFTIFVDPVSSLISERLKEGFLG